MPSAVDETAPLIQSHTLLPTLSEEDEDGNVNMGSQDNTKRKVKDTLSTRKFLRGQHSGHGGLFTGDRTYLPLHRRRRATEPSDVPIWKMLLIAVAALALLACIITACVLLDTVRHPTGPYPAPPTIPAEGVARNPAYLIKAKNGAVASENIVCSEIGIDVLKEGGNAVDAAIASTFCIGVVNLFSCVSFLLVVVLQTLSQLHIKYLKIWNRRRRIYDSPHSSIIRKCFL